MFKYAFFMNMPGETPDTCYGEYNNSESHARIVGLQKEDSEEYLKKLAEEGFEMVDLCGDFTGEDVSVLEDASGGKIKIRYANYSDTEMEKMNNLKSLSEYGIIVCMRGVAETEWLTIPNKQCNTKVAFIKDMDSAITAARQLVENGIYFIELCSWFDGEKTKEIIKSIEGAVPVGTCGEI